MMVQSDRPEARRSKTLLPPKQIMSGETRGDAPDEERWRILPEEVAKGELGNRGVMLKGVTVSLLQRYLGPADEYSVHIQ